MNIGNIIIKDVQWMTQGMSTFGFVKGIDTITQERKVFIGLGIGISEEEDIKVIVKIGQKYTGSEIDVLISFLSN